MSRFYVTTAIPYANGAPHIGHAYERIATDAIQRFMRLDGRDTLFVTGPRRTRPQGAAGGGARGVTPQAFVDRVAAEFEAMGELLNARADDIVRTTEPRNARASQEIWRRMAANGDVYLVDLFGLVLGAGRGLFRRERAQRRPGRRRSSRRPARRSSGSRRRAGFSASRPTQTSYSPITKPTPTSSRRRSISTRSSPSSSAACRTSRSAAPPFGWGVPVPDDPKHVMYVWVDALTNYLTATGFPDDGAALRNSGPPTRM